MKWVLLSGSTTPKGLASSAPKAAARISSLTIPPFRWMVTERSKRAVRPVRCTSGTKRQSCKPNRTRLKQRRLHSSCFIVYIPQSKCQPDRLAFLFSGYSRASASTGSSRAALRAGNQPNKMPVKVETQKRGDNGNRREANLPAG